MTEGNLRKIVPLALVTILVALVSEVFVESVQSAADTFGMTQAFVGFVVVALVGAAAEMLPPSPVREEIASI